VEIGPGAEIAGYRLEERIGHGGMGVVYRARQLDLDRVVAIKLIQAEHREDKEFTDRFQRESRLAASIDHPNVVPIFQAGESEGTYFIAMRFVAGKDLGQLLRNEGPLAPTRAAGLVADVAAGLDAAHSAGLVHRDVKPANVLLDERDHVYLTDFGLTKQISSQSGLTKTGVWYGALPYTAPEQIESSPLDARTDVYGLGCILFEALTGHLPHERDSEMAVMWAKVHEPPASASEYRPDLPHEFDDVLERALSRDPADRYQSAGDLGRAALAAARGEPATDPERTVARGAAAAPTAPIHPSRRDSGGVVEEQTRALGRDRGGGGNRAALVAIGAIAILAIGVMAAVAISSSGGTKTETIARTVTEEQPAPEVATSNSSETGDSAAASAAGPAETPLEPFEGRLYTAEVPSGWTAESIEKRISSRYESQWRNPQEENTSVLIDSQLHPESTSALEDAETVRAEASQSSGYNEISFAPITLPGLGVEAARWVFEVENDRRVDYFFVVCGDGFAVLGSASPESFGSWAPLFNEVAYSVSPRCE
jgi:serine/threonine protein kinase